jgi:hypothetical protein
MASRMRAETVFASRSKSRVNCRLRLIQAKVPSTIYRFSKTAKRWRWAAPDDLDRPASRGGDRRGRFRPLNPASAKMRSTKRKRRRACCNRSPAILNVGGQNAHAEQETNHVDNDVALAARDLLACVEALRVGRNAPF